MGQSARGNGRKHLGCHSKVNGVRHDTSLYLDTKNGPKAADLLQLQPPFDPLEPTDYPIKTYLQVSVRSLDIRYLSLSRGRSYF